MSTKTIIEYTDDIDGSRGAETITFSLDGTDYEIDLKGVNAKRFRRAVKPYAEHARPVRLVRPVRQTAGRRTTRSRDRSSQVRTWARDNGYTVGKMGRLPAEVIEAFEAAQGN